MIHIDNVGYSASSDETTVIFRGDFAKYMIILFTRSGVRKYELVITDDLPISKFTTHTDFTSAFVSICEHDTIERIKFNKENK